MKGDDGLEFVEFAQGPMKSRPGGLNAKPRQFQPKMFQTGVISPVHRAYLFQIAREKSCDYLY